MITLLSPAKTLDFDTSFNTFVSQPQLIDESTRLIDTLKHKDQKNIMALMKVSAALAELNVERYHKFHLPFTRDNAKPALLAFKGDVYQGLQAETFDADDLAFAQDHLRILSGLYGALRPLDLIQPYRLEMGTRLETARGKNLYEFWGDRITDLLNQQIAEQGHKLILNLASNEYFKSVNVKALHAPVVNIHFKEQRGEALKVIAFNAKKARGAMSRAIILERINEPEALKSLTINGYTYEAAGSDDHNMLFVK